MRCIRCQIEHDGTYGSGRYCSKRCAYFKDEDAKRKTSLAVRGIPKPTTRGINNPNYGGKYSRDPDVRKRMLDAIKLRGQGWDEKMRAEHSKKMKGGSNWMRGKHHNEETKRKIREKILNDFASGKRVPNKTMLSKPEKEIHSMLIEMGYRAKLGFRIEGKDFLYDIYVPERTLIVEYNGDYWHMNPSKYVATDYNSAVNKTAEEIWEKDETKKKVAVDNGYKFLRIWEKDYNKITDKRSMLKRLLSEI